MTDIIACPGLDYCNARDGPVDPGRTEHRAKNSPTPNLPGRRSGRCQIKISGCINACGHHHIGHIGILGLDKAGVESYQITLGGDATESAAIGDRTGPGFGYEEVADVVEKLVDRYVALREGPRETFLQTYRRVGMAPFKEAIYAD